MSVTFWAPEGPPGIKISPVCRCRELHLHIPAPFATRGTMSTRPPPPPPPPGTLSSRQQALMPPLPPLRYLVMGQYVCRIFLRCKKLPISTARHLRLRNPSYPWETCPDLFLTSSHPRVAHGMRTGTGVAPDAHGADYFRESASRENNS